MPGSPSLLLRAARTHVREDRLTELVAVVLAGHRGFAHRLLREAGVAVDGAVEVCTQVPTARGKRVDMEVLSLDSHGTVLGRLWSEHKTGSPYSPGQLRDYADDLDGIGGPGRLITIVDRLDQAPPGRWERFTWRQIAEWTWEAGRETGGAGWHETAQDPESPAQQRLLIELLSYLQEEHQTVIDPVTYVHVAAYAKASETQDMLYGLLADAADLCGYDREDGVDYPKEEFSQYWQIFNGDGTWAQPLDGYPELTIAESDGWTIDRAGEPAFGAGFTLPPDLHDQLRSADLLPWRERLSSEGVTVTEWESHVRVYRTLYLAELIAKGPTIDSQARAVARWADESFAIVAAHSPNITRTPPVKRTRGKEAASPDEVSSAAPTSDDPPAL